MKEEGCPNPYAEVQRMLCTEKKRQRIIEDKQRWEEAEKNRKKESKKYIEEMYGEAGPWAKIRQAREKWDCERAERRQARELDRQERSGIVREQREVGITDKRAERSGLIVRVKVEEGSCSIKHSVSILF